MPRLLIHMSNVHGINHVDSTNAFQLHIDDHEGRLDMEGWEHGVTDLYAYLQEDDE